MRRNVTKNVKQAIIEIIYTLYICDEKLRSFIRAFSSGKRII